MTHEDKVGRALALKLYPDGQPCEVCGAPYGPRGTVDRHHRSNNRMDNSPENIAWLCRKHHKDAHRATDGRVGGGPRPRVVAMMRGAAIRRLEESLALRNAGLTTGQIAVRMKVDPATVRRWRIKYGPQ